MDELTCPPARNIEEAVVDFESSHLEWKTHLAANAYTFYHHSVPAAGCGAPSKARFGTEPGLASKTLLT
jgi:hypothetical protein